MRKILLIGGCALALVACGGGGGGSTPSSSGTSVTPEPTPLPVQQLELPDQAFAAPLEPANTNITNCTGNNYIRLVDALESGENNSEFNVFNTIDNDLTNDSRWEFSEENSQLFIDLGYRHIVRGIGTAWYDGDNTNISFSILSSEDGINYQTLLDNVQSGGVTEHYERFDVRNTPARFIVINGVSDPASTSAALIEAAVFGCTLDVDQPTLDLQTVDLSQFNLDPELPPGENFDLLTWALDTPAADPDDGFAQRISETQLDDGYEDEFIFTAADGGMVFKSTLGGVTTSLNTNFTRSELREMLRRGDRSISTQGTNENNWVLGYQPNPGTTVGGRNGVLRATLAVNQVNSTGDDNQIGRFIIGQIHADDDEPLRLYYRKYPDNERGIIYLAHEIRGSDDTFRMIVGPVDPTPSNQPSNDTDPINGIALDEIFSYEIVQQDARIDVVIRRGDQEGPIIGHNFIDMNDENSGYDLPEEWMYFKAGSYSQNNTGDDDDFDQTTFYELINTHDVP